MHVKSHTYGCCGRPPSYNIVIYFFFFVFFFFPKSLLVFQARHSFQAEHSAWPTRPARVPRLIAEHISLESCPTSHAPVQYQINIRQILVGDIHAGQRKTGRFLFACIRRLSGGLLIELVNELIGELLLGHQRLGGEARLGARRESHLRAGARLCARALHVTAVVDLV